jgi:hypothetical protein
LNELAYRRPILGSFPLGLLFAAVMAPLWAVMGCPLYLMGWRREYLYLVTGATVLCWVGFWFGIYLACSTESGQAEIRGDSPPETPGTHQRPVL